MTPATRFRPSVGTLVDRGSAGLGSAWFGGKVAVAPVGDAPGDAEEVGR